jgi:hypothetical protein
MNVFVLHEEGHHNDTTQYIAMARLVLKILCKELILVTMALAVTMERTMMIYKLIGT